MNTTYSLIVPEVMDFNVKHRLMEGTLFVINQGWNVLIEQCSEVSASILLPNFQMNPPLLIQAIIRRENQ